MAPRASLGAAGLIAIFSSLALAEPPGSTAEPPARPATQASPLGQAACRACHPVEADHWSPTLHARLLWRPRGELARLGCEGCHGPGSRHAADPSNRELIVAFTRESGASVETMNGMCLACHAGGSRIYWT